MNKLADAIQIAAYAHNGQLDKAGEQYIFHPLRVMFQMDTEEERIVAVLHDVIEDTLIGGYELRGYNIPEKCVQAVEALTRSVTESVGAYYSRVKKNPLALKVKLADIRDNMDAERMNKLDTETRNRLFKKYDKALDILLERGNPAASISEGE